MKNNSFKKKKNNFLKLRKIEGVKFRIMWSSKIIGLFLISFAICISIALDGILYEGRSIELNEFVPFVGMTVIFLLFIRYLNGKFLGKIVAVINEQGIHTKDGVIPWRKIKQIVYLAPIPQRSSNLYSIFCSLTVTTTDNEYKILHAPRLMIKYIKKYVPSVEVKRDKELIISIILILVAAFVTPVMCRLDLF